VCDRRGEEVSLSVVFDGVRGRGGVRDRVGECRCKGALKECTMPLCMKKESEKVSRGESAGVAGMVMAMMAMTAFASVMFVCFMIAVLVVVIGPHGL
jgi:hypothetical protein